jgi:hypothetical protein
LLCCSQANQKKVQLLISCMTAAQSMLRTLIDEHGSSAWASHAQQCILVQLFSEYYMLCVASCGNSTLATHGVCRHVMDTHTVSHTFSHSMFHTVTLPHLSQDLCQPNERIG